MRWRSAKTPRTPALDFVVCTVFLAETGVGEWRCFAASALNPPTPARALETPKGAGGNAAENFALVA